jgi:hypothetical protein
VATSEEQSIALIPPRDRSRICTVIRRVVLDALQAATPVHRPPRRMHHVMARYASIAVACRVPLA